MFGTQQASYIFATLISLFAYTVNNPAAFAGSHWGDPNPQASAERQQGPRVGMRGAEVSLRWAELSVSRLVLEDCDGVASAVESHQTLNPVRGDRLALPAGAWCAVEIELDRPVKIAGETADGSPLILSLDLATLTLPLRGPLAVGGGALSEEPTLDLLAEGWDRAIPREGPWLVGPSGARHAALLAAIDAAEAAR